MIARNAGIVATASYVPERVIPNSWFNEQLGEDVDTWLRSNVEIFNRHWCADNESTADLVAHTARTLLTKSGVAPDAIDLLIVATDTPEYISPSTASVVQDRLGLVSAGTFDLNTACAGFVTALDVASKYIRADERYNRVMVIGAYAMSKYLNLQDKKTVTLFADGAAGVLLENTGDLQKGFRQSELRTQGQYHGWMGIYGGGTAKPVNENVLHAHEHQLQFVKRFPKELNPQVWSAMAMDLCTRENIVPSEIDHFFLTQINVHSIRETMERLGVDASRAATIMHEYGYTGSACIPMALDAWNTAGKLRSGDRILFIGSGGGLAFGAALFTL